jgi:predicted RNA-binding protein with EMAP domain
MDREEVQRPDDHEARMAKADLYKLAQYSAKLFKMVEEGDELQGWVQSKITKASDYISSVYHYMDYEQVKREAMNEKPTDFEESVHESIKNDLYEKWSEKYKRSIDCNNPKGFSQKAHCAGKTKR